VDYARRVRAAGFRTAVLSNLPHDLGEHMRAHMSLLKEFDHHTFSYELRAAKPEPAIYEHCVKGLGVPASETVFIDDRPENVEGARAYGLRAILFESPRQLHELTRNADDLVALRSTPVILE
jgi:putative hydrolase of the HAD superfamily